MTLDTTGVAPGNYPLHLYYELPPYGVAAPSELPPFRSPTLIDGTLTVLPGGAAALVPEPSALVLLAFGVVGLIAFGCRRRKRWAARPVAH